MSIWTGSSLGSHLSIDCIIITHCSAFTVAEAWTGFTLSTTTEVILLPIILEVLLLNPSVQTLSWVELADEGEMRHTIVPW